MPPITNQHMVPLATAFALSNALAGRPVSLSLLETAVDGIPMMTHNAFFEEVLDTAPVIADHAREQPRLSALWRMEAVFAQPVPEGLSAFDITHPSSDPDPAIDAALKKILSQIKTEGRVSAPSLCSLGDAYLRAMRYEEALISYQRALRLQPHPRTHTGLAVLYRQIGQFEDSLDAIDAAMRMENGGRSRSYYEKGVTLRKMDRLEEAVDCFDRAIRLERGRFANSFMQRAITLQRLGRWDEALQDIDAAIRLNALRPQAHCERARVLRRLQRLAEARDSIRTALALDPNCPFSLDEWRRIESLATFYKK